MAKCLLYFCFIASSLGHPDRIRYVDPDKQREYDEYCSTHKGHKIPPDSKTFISSFAEPLKRLKETSNIRKSGASSKTYSSIQKSLAASTSSSSSPSSIPPTKKSITFISSGWFWNEELGWLYLYKESYPYVYSHNDKKWITLVLLR